MTSPFGGLSKTAFPDASFVLARVTATPDQSTRQMAVGLRLVGFFRVPIIPGQGVRGSGSRLETACA